MTYIQHYDAPLGRILLAADEVGLTGLWFDGAKYFADGLPAEHTERETPILSEARRWLDLYFAGQEPGFLPPLHPAGSTFQQAVWALLLQIPYGQTTTYGALAKLLAEKNGDTISTAANTKFADIPAHAWYSGYVKYLSNNGITYCKSKTVIAPNDAITRAEFTTMAVRFIDVYGSGVAEIMEQFSGFNDVSSGYWAAEYIKYAALHGWINGYGDGSFHAEREINRAAVVTIVNRLLGREADEDYIADNLRKLNTFPDVTKRHWAYYAVMEAANAHTAVLGENESWSK